MAFYEDNRENLREAVAKLPPAVQAALSGDIVITIDDIGNPFMLTMGEVGEICELVRQVITREMPVEKFEESLKEKLAEAEDDDNLPRVGEIVWEVNDKIFVKLLPVLGLKPLTIVAKPVEKYQGVSLLKQGGEVATTAVAAPTISRYQGDSLIKPTPPPAPPRVVPLTKIFPPPPPPPRPQTLPPQLMAPVHVMPPQPAGNYPGSLGAGGYKPPTSLVEPSHERMSENPTDSFLKMLSGKLNEKELQTRFDKLPYALKTALRSVDSAKRVVDIGRKYALHMDKLGLLGEETGLVILGMTHPNQFLPRLTRRLGISEEMVRPIAQEINTEVFLKIREALKQINNEPLQPQPNPRASQNYSQGPSLIKNSAAEQANYQPRRTPPQQAETRQEETEGALDRDAILRDIENPTSIRPPTPPYPSSAASSGSPTSRPPYPSPSSGSPLTTAPTPTPDEPPFNLPGENQTPPFMSEPEKPAEMTPEMPAPEPEPEPTTQAPAPKNTVDQKLSDTTAAAKSETSYTADPYREPLG